MLIFNIDFCYVFNELNKWYIKGISTDKYHFASIEKTSLLFRNLFLLNVMKPSPAYLYEKQVYIPSVHRLLSPTLNISRVANMNIALIAFLVSLMVGMQQTAQAAFVRSGFVYPFPRSIAEPQPSSSPAIPETK